jgi:O-antigen/teichoic acid export membrane protein
MINFLKELGDVGLYSLAVNFTDEILLIASSIALALFPHINEKPEQSLEITLKTTRILSLFLIIILTMSAIFYFFGKNFMGSLPSFYILTLAIYFLSICTIISQFFASKSFP